MANEVGAKFSADVTGLIANLNLAAEAGEATGKRFVKAVETNNRLLAQQNRLLKETAAAAKASEAAAGSLEKTAKAAGEAEQAIERTSKATHEFSVTGAGSMREFLVLFHEGVTGNFKRMAGSAVVLAERTNLMSVALSSAGGVIAGVGAVVAGFAAAAIQAHEETENFRHAMILTGGAAGVTQGQMREMAAGIASSTGQSLGRAKEALMELVKSGEVAPQNLQRMGQAVLQVSHLSGEGAEEVAKKFAGMADGVTEWLSRNKQYNDLFTASQIAALREMERTHDMQGAMGVALDNINAKTKDAATGTETLTASLSRLWNAFQVGAGFVQGTENPLAVIDARIAAINARLKANPNASWNGAYKNTIGGQQDTADLKSLNQDRARVAAAQAFDRVMAAQQGAEVATQRAGKAADEHTDKLLKESRGANAATEAMARLKAEFKERKAAGLPDYTESEQKAIVATEMRKHRDPGEHKLDDEYATALKSMGVEDARLKAETESLVTFGRAMDDSREAVMRFRVENEKGDLHAIAGTPKADVLIGAAAQADVDGRKRKDAEAAVAAVRRLDDEYKSAIKSASDEKAKLDAQTEGYVKFGRAVSDSREAVMRLRIEGEQGDLHGLNARGAGGVGPSRGEALIGAARATDESAQRSRDAETLAGINKQVDSYIALAHAKELSERDKYVQQALGAHGLGPDQIDTLEKGQEAYRLATQAGLNYDKEKGDSAAKSAAERQRATDEEVRSINRESAALTETNLARQIGADTAKLQKAADEALLKPEADSVAINAQLAKNIAQVTAARMAQNAAARNPQLQAGHAAEQWGEQASDQGRIAATMTTSSLDAVSKAIENLAHTGRTNFASLWKSMADEFENQIIRMQVAKLAAGTGNFWGGLIGLLGGGGGAGNGAAAGSLSLGGIDGEFADGGSVSAGGTFLVGERGPELFRPAAAGTIIPNSELSGGSGGTAYHIGANPIYNIGAGVSRAEVVSAVQQGNSQTLAQVQRLSSTGKLR